MKRFWVVIMLATLGFAGASLAEGRMMVIAGHQIKLVEATGDNFSALFVDGQRMLEDGNVVLDEPILHMGGAAVLTGVVGDGNACDWPPFVLMLPKAGKPQVFGPINSCAYLKIVDIQSDAIIFASKPRPGYPGEVWTWTLGTGFTAATPVGFSPTGGMGWDQLPDLNGAYPSEAMALEQVYRALVVGLGPDFDMFAKRVSAFSSPGALSADGYLGEGCLKFTCEEDFGVLFLHAATRKVFAIWHVKGEIENRSFPADTRLWPPEALALLRERAPMESP